MMQPRPRRPVAFVELLLLFGALFACAGSTTNNEPATPAEESESSESDGTGTAGSANGGSCSGDDCPATTNDDSTESTATSTPSSPPDVPAPMYGSAGSGSCADNGDSCANDSAVMAAKTECGGNPPTQRPCYCAATLTYDCFFKHGCYAEAGAATSVTQAQLVSGRDAENAKAIALGASCL